MKSLLKSIKLIHFLSATDPIFDVLGVLKKNSIYQNLGLMRKSTLLDLLKEAFDDFNDHISLFHCAQNKIQLKFFSF